MRSAFVLAVFGWGVGLHGPYIFLSEVINRTGWSLNLVSSAVTLHYLCGALVIPQLPRSYAQFGLPRITCAGALLTAAGMFGWAMAAQPWQLLLAASATGAGWVTLGAVPINAIVSPWYVRLRPAALSKAYNGASVGGVVFAPLWIGSIAVLGFAGATLAVGGTLILVVGLLARHVFGKTPDSLGQQPDGDAVAGAPQRGSAPMHPELPGARLWRNRAFATLAAGMAVGLFAQIGLLAHLFNVLLPTLGAAGAGLLLGSSTGCAILGRQLAARAIGRGHARRRVAAASYAIQALGLLVLIGATTDQIWLIVVGALLFGSGVGNATSLPPLIAQTDFAPRDVTRVVALVVAMAQGTYAFAPAFFGVLQTAIHAGQATVIGVNASGFFGTVLALQLGAAAILLAGRRRPPAARS